MEDVADEVDEVRDVEDDRAVDDEAEDDAALELEEEVGCVEDEDAVADFLYTSQYSAVCSPDATIENSRDS